jgi:hypothetical protein
MHTCQASGQQPDHGESPLPPAEENNFHTLFTVVVDSFGNCMCQRVHAGFNCSCYLCCERNSVLCGLMLILAKHLLPQCGPYLRCRPWCSVWYSRKPLATHSVVGKVFDRQPVVSGRPVEPGVQCKLAAPKAKKANKGKENRTPARKAGAKDKAQPGEPASAPVSASVFWLAHVGPRLCALVGSMRRQDVQRGCVLAR